MYTDIRDRKQNITLDELCSECPIEFQSYFEYCRNLGFDEKPDYLYMKNLFSTLAHREGIDLFDNTYDWSVKATVIKHFPAFFDFIVN